MAHPEFKGYLKAYTLEERLAHVREAKRTLGTRIPWLVDGMDNALSSHLGHWPNAEIILDASGRLISKRAWNDPRCLRRDLERLLGPVSASAPIAPPPPNRQIEPAPVNQRVLSRIKVPRGMKPLKLRWQRHPKPYYVKLRAEASPGLLEGGKGRLYLGFSLDPTHAAHWNNLNGPFRLILATGPHFSASLNQSEGPEIATETDDQPREFILELDWYDPSQPLRISTFFSVCHEEQGWCRPVKRDFQIWLEPDPTAGWRLGPLMRRLIEFRDRKLREP